MLDVGFLRQIRRKLEWSADFHTNNREGPVGRQHASIPAHQISRMDPPPRYYHLKNGILFVACTELSDVVAFRLIGHNQDCFPINRQKEYGRVAKKGQQGR